MLISAPVPLFGTRAFSLIVLVLINPLFSWSEIRAYSPLVLALVPLELFVIGLI